MVNIKLQFGKVAKQLMIVGNDVSAIVAVVVVGAYADSSRQIVEDTIGEVHLSTIDVLLTFHLRVEVILVGCDTLAGQHGGKRDVEHRDTLVVFHKAAAANDTNHRR